MTNHDFKEIARVTIFNHVMSRNVFDKFPLSDVRSLADLVEAMLVQTYNDGVDYGAHMPRIDDGSDALQTRSEIMALFWSAAFELNAIRARDGAPQGVDPEYFDRLVNAMGNRYPCGGIPPWPPTTDQKDYLATLQKGSDDDR